MTKSISRRVFFSVASMAALSAAAIIAGCSTGSEQRGAQTEDESGGTQVESENSSTAKTEPTQATSNTGKGKSLIVLYSWSGNTLQMAQRLQDIEPDAGFFRIEPVEAYPDDYDETADRAKQERDDGVMVPYLGDVEDWESYDTVYLGYPIWWYELPQAVKKFISDHDWTGKTIYPFNTHEGSGDGGTPEDIAKLAAGATVGDNLAIRGGDVSGSLDQVDEWHSSLK